MFPEKEGMMSLEQFKHVLSEIRPLRINFTGDGESLINKETIKMIRYASDKDVSSYMTSNFTLVEEVARDIVKSGLKLIRVSMDAATKETYKEIRGLDMFDRVCAGVKALSQTKKRLGSPTPIIRVNNVLIKQNFKELPAMVEITKNFGIDILYLKPMVLFSEEQLNILPGHGLTKQEAIGIIKQAYELSLRLNIKTNLKQVLKDFENNWENISQGRQHLSKDCYEPWVSTFVRWNGDVVLCCNGAFEPQAIMGNIFEKSFRDIWNGERYKNLRKSILMKKMPFNACSSCLTPFLKDLIWMPFSKLLPLEI